MIRSKIINFLFRIEKILIFIYKECSLYLIFDNFKFNYLSDYFLIFIVRYCGVGCVSFEERVWVDYYKDWIIKGVFEYCLFYGD